MNCQRMLGMCGPNTTTNGDFERTNEDFLKQNEGKFVVSHLGQGRRGKFAGANYHRSCDFS